MMNLRNTLLTLGTSALLLTGFSPVNAQQSATGISELQTHGRRQGSAKGQRLRGIGGIGRLALGTSIEVRFYDGDPEAGGSVTDTLQFTYGEDSEAAFANALTEARNDAAFVIVNISEQNRTVELADLDTEARQRGTGLLGRGLNGGTVTATFYDGDPETGGQVLETLSFTHGVDSAAGFRAEVRIATESASFVTVTRSPEERTIDLSAGAERRGPGFRRGGRF